MGEKPATPARADRRRAVARAGHAGDLEAARAGLADADPSVRAAALGALERLGRLSTDELEAALRDPEPAVRRRACEAAARVPGGTGAPLLALLGDADPTVVEVAAWASGERDPAEPGAVARLAELATGHDDALVREAAVAALGSLGDPAGLAAILAATGDKATVRRRAIIALAPFDGPEVDAALARARDDRDWQVRQAAEDLSD
jgi:HEAT repeat protein